MVFCLKALLCRFLGCVPWYENAADLALRLESESIRAGLVFKVGVP